MYKTDNSILAKENLVKIEHKEKELKEQQKSLINQLNDIIKKSGGGIFVSDNLRLEEVRIKSINYLIASYQNKILKIETEIQANSNKRLEDAIESFNRQLNSNSHQSNILKNRLLNISSSINQDCINQKNFSHKNFSNLIENSSNKKKEENTVDEKEKGKSKTIENIIDIANAELHIQKFELLNESIKIQNENKEKEKKIKKYLEYMNIFSKLKSEYEETIKKKDSVEREKESAISIKKFNQEIMNFDINLLKNIDKINHENDSLLTNLNIALNNIKKLDNKITNMNIDKKNDKSKRILMGYKWNSNLAKQNNILSQEIINFSNVLYEKIFNKEVKETKNNKDFIELKETIDDFKANYVKKAKEKKGEVISNEEEHKIEKAVEVNTNDGVMNYDSDDYI